MIPCQACHDKSVWDLLHQSFQRMEETNRYALKLEEDIMGVTSNLTQSQFALAECQNALYAKTTTLDQERLEFRALQEALTFERERHLETTQLLEQTFEEAKQRGQRADMLSTQNFMLRATKG